MLELIEGQEQIPWRGLMQELQKTMVEGRKTEGLVLLYSLQARASEQCFGQKGGFSGVFPGNTSRTDEDTRNRCVISTRN